MKILSITAVAAVLLMSMNCSAQNTNKTDQNKLDFIFQKGELGPAENFTGKAWNIGLVENDSIYNTIIGNVFLSPEKEATGTGIHRARS